MLSVKVLMERVVVTSLVLEKQGCRPRLPSIVASLDEVNMLFRIADIDAHCDVPAIGNGRQPRIDGCSKIFNDLGQRIVEVLVLAPSKAMLCHDDMASKEAILRIKLSQSLTLVRG